ncbi:uncharacterized protein LOC9316769 [Arabidopsis lyrata subsp. lyrata]|uniref:uncharacterized protein LOC9316769 n=1 Tax=Arabidopsis lyrata subsp. lyrata TaxID=81972 RepID=UPI000A29BCB7|nr:uncharacterized protein LOC9316769 [Arabidopsis lyrata subsp. lyrata]|eukprot:XP_020883577.1 uncharacterized protein LOC9316769 [Arabidopsis lyrata subsp. lyrata]
MVPDRHLFTTVLSPTPLPDPTWFDWDEKSRLDLFKRHMVVFAVGTSLASVATAWIDIQVLDCDVRRLSCLNDACLRTVLAYLVKFFAVLISAHIDIAFDALVLCVCIVELDNRNNHEAVFGAEKA